MFCNGRKTGFAVRREATDDDLAVMETLRPVSMGAGVLPGSRSGEWKAALGELVMAAVWSSLIRTKLRS
ncbi:hypothetical protein E2562_000389 [Oryza meyeriana var. granulata]|uniref:Uncharacterized protein n=1 Tax=Oryza meyeriana var. granulata TaxID=110450 RepID=A0A6G1CC89_9ORYZ|nr:hypothetical protein E2562_000389 [Oryza meyeriana var. granulata]